MNEWATYRLCNLKLDTTFIAADVYQCLSSVKSFKVDLQRNCSPRLSFIISLSMQIDRWRRSKINDRVTKAPSAIATAQGLFAFWNHPNGLLMSVPQCKEVRSVNMWCCARQAFFFSSMLFFQWSILQKQRFFLKICFFFNSHPSSFYLPLFSGRFRRRESVRLDLDLDFDLENQSDRYG